MLKIKKISFSTQNIAELSVCFLLFYNSFGSEINWIFQGIANRSFTFGTNVFRAIGLFFLVLAFLIRKRPIEIDMIFVAFFLVLTYVLSMLNETTASEIIRQNLIVQTFFGALPVYFAIRLSDNYSFLWKCLGKFSICSFFLLIVSFFLINVGSSENYRTYSEHMLLVVSYFLIEWLYKNSNNKRNTLFTIIGALLIATCGRRSSLVSLLLILIVICLIQRRFKIIFFGIVITIVLYFIWIPLLNQTYQIFVSFGVRPRILRKIIVGNIGDDAHRFEQWSYVFELIFSSLNRTIFGLGIVGERYYMLNHFQHMVLQGYPHNIIVEVIGHYGIILGPIFCIYLFFIWPVLYIKKNRASMYHMIIFLFALTNVSALLFQDSYTQSRSFFFYLGVILGVGALHGKKNESENKYIQKSFSDYQQYSCH